jgi:mono/diheme cytochrome c family protein
LIILTPRRGGSLISLNAPGRETRKIASSSGEAVMRYLKALICGLVIGSPAWAQTLDVPPEADAAEGAALYQRHCAVCHGAEARGNGPLAPALILQPPDLTGLSAANGGRFPLLRVIMRIDGRDPLVSHGSPMPVFGPFFDGRDLAMKAESGQPILTSQPVVDLVAWLRGIQE